MKKALFTIFFVIFLLSCKKDKFKPSSEYEKLIGTWVNINGDIEREITFKLDGKVIEKSEVDRTERYQILSSTTYFYDGNYFFSFVVKNSEYTRGIKYTQNFDTIYHYKGAFNQPDSSFNQYTYFIRKK